MWLNLLRIKIQIFRSRFTKEVLIANYIQGIYPHSPHHLTSQCAIAPGKKIVWIYLWYLQVYIQISGMQMIVMFFNCWIVAVVFIYTTVCVPSNVHGFIWNYKYASPGMLRHILCGRLDKYLISCAGRSICRVIVLFGNTLVGYWSLCKLVRYYLTSDLYKFNEACWVCFCTMS